MDDKLWAFVVISVMWGGVLYYMMSLKKKADRLEKLLDESEEK